LIGLTLKFKKAAHGKFEGQVKICFEIKGYKMKPTEIYKKFNEANVRVEKIFHLGSMCIHGCVPETLKLTMNEYMDEVTDIDDIDVKSKITDVETLIDFLIEKERLGFLLHVATPIPDFVKNCKTPSITWDKYTTEWIYAETFEEAAEVAIKWATGLYAELSEKHQISLNQKAKTDISKL